MKTLSISLLLTVSATPAWAHPGHGGGIHAHPEWLVAGLVGLVAVAALWWRARR